MDIYSDRKEMLVRNLQDIGLDNESIDKFLSLHQHHEQLQILYNQRCKLLEKIHADQKQIDCLDYLVYIIKKNSECIE